MVQEERHLALVSLSTTTLILTLSLRKRTRHFSTYLYSDWYFGRVERGRYLLSFGSAVFVMFFALALFGTECLFSVRLFDSCSNVLANIGPSLVSMSNIPSLLVPVVIDVWASNPCTTEEVSCVWLTVLILLDWEPLLTSFPDDSEVVRWMRRFSDFLSFR